MEEEDHYWKKKRSYCTTFTTKSTTTTTELKTIISWLPIIVILVIVDGPARILAEGNVGCHFVKSLCIEHIEFCYDDKVFGKCLARSGVEQDDLERAQLTEEQSQILLTMLEEMQGAGLGWDHPFVQCRIQGTLFSIRKNTPLLPNLCANLAPDPQIIDPHSPLAFVRFTTPNEDYADEVYYPTFNKKGINEQFYLPYPAVPPPPPPPRPHLTSLSHQYQPLLELKPSTLHRFENNVNLLSRIPQTNRFNGNNVHGLADDQDWGEEGEQFYERELENQKLANRISDIQNQLKLKQILNAYEQEREREQILFDENPQTLSNIHHFSSNSAAQMPLNTADNNRFRNNYKRNEIEHKNQEDHDNELPTTFFRELAKTEHIQLNPEVESYNHYKNNPLEVILPAFKTKNSNDDETIDENYFASNTYPVKYSSNRKMKLPESSGLYTEGGFVYLPEHGDNSDSDFDRQEETRNLLENMLGFTRHERLDVKKPGPIVGPPPQDNSTGKVNHAQTTTTKPSEINNSKTKEILPAHIKGSHSKKATKTHSDEDHAPHSVDTEYAHVILKNPLDNWKDGLRIVTALADILHMQPYFTHTRVDRHEVTFRVEANPEKKTAADVAKAINDARTKTNLFRRLGVTVIRAGVGDKIKSDVDSVSASKLELADEGPDVTHIMAYMFAGAGAAAIIVIVITLLLIRRHDQKKNKLGGLQAGVSGVESCSKDYQELCRARMAGKGETISSGRITSLSKENDRPPSSRSSTSSWSEEPALTNMDISTGHMVLSYMEDHLRNKGRLQREWEALCRYEAEPSAREAALQTQCTPLNRPGAPLPFDHSRVVLNHLANAEGLDYVNASTITDHDPRAPAYVAAQGPLPTTLAHFWQMIWEQGAVIIVALCRLQENGEVACARYWPEEGAEVYHIYEVHLVSEHIWCDDYLVRSFYLKNLRTSETRTVTQFHFLSWPQGGVPSSAKALLEFRRKVNKSYRGRSCPIVVHSSHGAGRTGAYILLDLVLGRMNKGAREIDIAATLEHLRDQRAGLVATRQQFEFVLMAVAEEVHAILKALPSTNSTSQSGSTEKRNGNDKDDKEPALMEEDDTAEETEIQEKQVKSTSEAKVTATASSLEKTENVKDKKVEKKK